MYMHRRRARGPYSDFRQFPAEKSPTPSTPQQPVAHSLGGFRDAGCRERSNFRNPPPDFFHHRSSVTRITDFQSNLRNNGDLIGAVKSVPVFQDGPRNCPKTIFSAF